MAEWHLITGEYPPQPGGVSDYSRLLAAGLAARGDRVHVWAPPASGSAPDVPGVFVHTLPDHFGLRSLRHLSRQLDAFPAPRQLIIQYVPHAFGWKALNWPFSRWLRSRRSDRITVFFHEVRFPLEPGQPLRHRLLGHGTTFMARWVIQAADRIFVSNPRWGELVRLLEPRSVEPVWLPVPSNIPVSATEQSVHLTRQRIAPSEPLVGHFGTYGALVARDLVPWLRTFLNTTNTERILLLGYGNQEFRDRLAASLAPDQANRLIAAGAIGVDELSSYIACCDLMVQPYPDGLSCRRGTAMASLAHGRPIVTNRGPATESIWEESGAVAFASSTEADDVLPIVRNLLSDPAERARLGARALEIYRDRFRIENTVDAMRASIVDVSASPGASSPKPAHTSH